MGRFTVTGCLLVLVAGSPASAQVLKVEPLKSLAATKVAMRASAQKPALAKGIPQNVHAPVRMTAADYQAMLPHLATLTGLPRTSLAGQPVAATNLATPGNILNIGLGPAPAGGGFQAAHADWVLNYSAMSLGSPVPPCIVFWLSPGPANTGQQAGFTAPI